LPLETASVDAATAFLTLHHWTDLERGLQEMARVARKRVVILTWIPDAPQVWLTEDYFPEILAYDLAVFPRSDVLVTILERTVGPAQVTPLLIPHDCTDGFLSAYWRRPEAYLDAGARSAISSFSRFDAGPGLARLAADLAEGRWEQRYGHLRALEAIDAGYRIVTCEIGAA